MVDVITPTITQFSNGVTPALLLTFTGFNGDGEYGIFDAWSEGLTWLPAAAVAIVTRTAGETAEIDVDVDGSMDGTVYVATALNNITAKDTYDYMPAPDGGEPDSTGYTRWRYWRVIVNTVGEGNTLTVELWLFPW